MCGGGGGSERVGAEGGLLGVIGAGSESRSALSESAPGRRPPGADAL